MARELNPEFGLLTSEDCVQMKYLTCLFFYNTAVKSPVWIQILEHVQNLFFEVNQMYLLKDIIGTKLFPNLRLH